MNARARIAPPSGRTSVQPGSAVTLRLDDLPSVAAKAPGVERVTLDQLHREPTLDDALHDLDLFDLHVGPFVENAEELRPPSVAAADPEAAPKAGPSGPASTEEKARRLVAEGRVRLSADGGHAVVDGEHAAYTVRLTGYGPSCDCPSYRRRCSHALAVELLTEAARS